MDTTIIAAIIGLLGLFLGFLFNGIGYLLRERYKSIRVVNQNLFYLLKALLVTLALKNINKLVALYTKKLKEHPATKDLIRVDENILNQLCNEFLASLISPIYQKVNEEFKQKFKESIFELSKIKPVVAYELSKTSYNEALSQEIDRIKQSTDHHKNQSKEFIDCFKSGAIASQKHILTELESKLIRGIKKISWSSNLFIWFSCRFEIYKLKQKSSAIKMNAYLDSYFETTILPLMDQYKNNQAG